VPDELTPEEQQAANNRIATKQMRVDIHRVLVRWDPLSLKGLRGAEKEYEPFVGELLLMVKRDAGEMEIARHLADVMKNQWRLPADNKRCVEAAKKLKNIGAIYMGGGKGANPR